MSGTDRRHFFKQFGLSLVSLALAPYVAARARLAAAADGKLPALSEDDPTAKILGYRPDAAKVDLKKWPKKAGADGKNQKCATCMFFTSIDKTSGKCQIFPNNTVNPA